jgi:hypothetical protein
LTQDFSSLDLIINQFHWVSLFAASLTVEPRINTYFISQTRGLFLTCTQGIFFFYIGYTSIIYQTFRACMDLLYGKKPLTWKVRSLYMALKPHPCWSPAQSQLPHLRPPPLLLPSPLPMPSSHQHDVYFRTDDINTPGSSSVRHTPEIRFDVAK